MNVALRPFNVLSLCTGGGGLDLAVKLAIPSTRVVCVVEREVTAAALLVAHMQAGNLDDAPVWSDLRTFDGRPWRGLVDAVVGGIPCQPWSVAGKRRGADDERNLWPDTLRIIRECEPGVVFIENVAGILRDGFHGIIKPDLERAGYRVAADIFTAAEVGAPHERKRLFILAHARERARGAEQGPQRQSERDSEAVAGEASRELGYRDRERWQAGIPAGERAGSEPETGRRAIQGHVSAPPLAMQAEMWTTPKSRDWKGGIGAAERHSPDLDKMAEAYQPSRPAPVSEIAGLRLLPLDLTWHQRYLALITSTSGADPEIYRFWSERAHSRGWAGEDARSFYRKALNAVFVTWLMNWPLDWFDVTGFPFSETA